MLFLLGCPVCFEAVVLQRLVRRVARTLIDMLANHYTFIRHRATSVGGAQFNVGFVLTPSRHLVRSLRLVTTAAALRTVQPFLTQSGWGMVTFKGRHRGSFFVRGAGQNHGVRVLVTFVPSSLFLPFPFKRAIDVRCPDVLRFQPLQNLFGEVGDHSPNQPVRKNGV